MYQKGITERTTGAFGKRVNKGKLFPEDFKLFLQVQSVEAYIENIMFSCTST